MRNIWNNNTALSDYYPYSDNTNKSTVTVYSSAICYLQIKKFDKLASLHHKLLLINSDDLTGYIYM